MESAMAAAEISPQSSTRSNSSSTSSAPVHAASSPPSRTGPSFSSASHTPPQLFVVAAPSSSSDAPQHTHTAPVSMLSSPMQLHHADTSLATQHAPLSKEQKSGGSGGGATKFFSNLFSRGQNNTAQSHQSPQHQHRQHSAHPPQPSGTPLHTPSSAPAPHVPQHHLQQHHSAPSHALPPPPSSAPVVVSQHHARVPSGSGGPGQDSPDLEFGSRMAASSAAAAAASSASRLQSSTHQTVAVGPGARPNELSPPLHGGASRGSHASWMSPEYDAPPTAPASMSHLSLSLSDGSDHSLHPGAHAASSMPVPSPPARAQAHAVAKSSAHGLAFGPSSQQQQHHPPRSAEQLSASSLVASSPSPRASSLSLDSVVPSPQTAPSGGVLSPEFLSPDSTRVWSYGS